jgi:hypothetical protein
MNIPKRESKQKEYYSSLDLDHGFDQGWDGVGCDTMDLVNRSEMEYSTTRRLECIS